MIGSFLIFLREGIEGSMIVSIVLTYLASAGRKDLFRWAFAGVVVALLGSTAIGVGLYVAAQSAFVGSRAQNWFETITFVVAVCILTAMTFWMKKNSRNLSGALKEELSGAIRIDSGLAVATVCFVTVGREAIETAIFTLAIAFHTTGVYLFIGAVLGLAVALSASIAMYRLGVRLNLKRLFTVLGVCLLVIAAGLLANAVENLQQLGVLPGADQVLWNTGRWMSEESGAGDVLHGLLGYASAPTALQLLAWLVFLLFSLGLFADIHARVPKRGRAIS